MAEVWRFFAHEDDFADIDEVGACERLGRVLSFPTISSMDAQTVDWQPFDDLRAPICSRRGRAYLQRVRSSSSIIRYW